MEEPNEPLEPFGELRTDEARTETALERLRRDQDAKLLGGCVIFSVSAVIQSVSAITAFAIANPKTVSSLNQASLTVVCIALVAAIACIMIEPIAGYFGSIAGLLPGCIFLFLRIRENALGFPGVKGAEPAEFAASAAITIPTMIWFGTSLLLLLPSWIRHRFLFQSRSEESATNPPQP